MQGVLDTTLCYKVCQWLAAGLWVSAGTSVSSTNITDCHDIAEILLKVALNTITLALFMTYFLTHQAYKGQVSFCHHIYSVLHCRLSHWYYNKGAGLWCLMPLSTIFHLYNKKCRVLYITMVTEQIYIWLLIRKNKININCHKN